MPRKSKDLNSVTTEQACVFKIATFAYQLSSFVNNFHFVQNPAPFGMFLWMVSFREIGFPFSDFLNFVLPRFIYNFAKFFSHGSGVDVASVHLQWCIHFQYWGYLQI